MPIPGCKTVAQAREQLATLDWDLEDNEVGIIDERLDEFQK